MAINKKLIIIETKDLFNKLLANLADTSIVFIQDTGELWTHGKLFAGNFSSVDNNKISLTLAGLTIELSKASHTHSYLPLSGGTLTIGNFYGLTIKRNSANGSAILFSNSNGALAGIGILADKSFVVSSGSTTSGDMFKVTSSGVAYAGGVELSKVGHTHSYLPLTGGTLSGSLTFSSGNILFNTNSVLRWTNGTYLLQISITDDSSAGTSVFNFQQSSNSGGSWSTLASIYDNGYIHATGFYKNGSSNAYVLLGDGGHKKVSDFASASSLNNYVLKSNSGSASIVADSDSSTTSEYLSLKAGKNELKVISNGSSLDKNKLTYNGYKIWHSGNQGSGSGLDADLLDGKQLSDVLSSITEINIIRKRSSDADSLVNASYLKSNIYLVDANSTNIPQTTGGYIVSFIWDGSNWASQYFFDSQLQGICQRFRNSSNVWSEWKRYAFITDNVASASKLQTARSINGTNFDGSASITTANWGTTRTLTIGNSGKSVNGSGNVSWSLSEIGAAASGHTHNYAGSSSAGGAANSANILNNNSRMEYGWNGVNYFNADLDAGTAAKVNNSPTSAWWHILRFNHANSSGYYTDLAVPFNANSLYYKRVGGGVVQNDGWVKVLDALNYSGVLDSRYYTESEINAKLAGYSTTNHTHSNIISRGSVTAESGTTRPTVSGLSMSKAYNNGYPYTYGNVISLKGDGDGQIFIGWSGISGGHAPVYVRSKRDMSDANWSSWAQFYTTAHKPTPADIGAAASSHTHSYLPLSGGTMNNDSLISRAGSSQIWIYGRIGALIRSTNYTGYNPIASMKTTNGSWDLGVYESNILYFNYITDSDYNSGNNRLAAYMQFKSDGKIYSSGFIKSGSSSSYVLLGDGGHKAISDFSGVEYLKNYSSSNPNSAYRDLSVKWFAQINLSSGYAGNRYGFPVENNANGILWLGAHGGNYGHQLGFSSNGNIYQRYISNGSFPTTTNGISWKLIAFTTSNVLSASQLQTPRTIWGKRFNGTLDLSGDLSYVGHISLNADLLYNIGSASRRVNTIYTNRILCGGSNTLLLGNTSSIININSSGNVGIGTSYPSCKLDVNGDIRGTSAFKLDSTKSFTINSNSSGFDIFSTGNLCSYYTTDFILYQGTSSIYSPVLKCDKYGIILIGGSYPYLEIDTSNMSQSSSASHRIENAVIFARLDTNISMSSFRHILGWNDSAYGGYHTGYGIGTRRESSNVWGSMVFEVCKKFDSATDAELARMELRGSDNVLWISGRLTQHSDIRLKSDILPLTNRGFITPIRFSMNGNYSLGFSALEMLSKYPELVIEDSTKEKYLSINYSGYTAVLQAQIIELNNKLEQMQIKFNNLVKQLNNTTN